MLLLHVSCSFSCQTCEAFVLTTVNTSKWTPKRGKTADLTHCWTHCPSWRNNGVLRELWQRVHRWSSTHCKQPGEQTSHSPLIWLAKKFTGHLETHVCCVVRNCPVREEDKSKELLRETLDEERISHRWRSDLLHTLYTGFSHLQSRTRRRDGSPHTPHHLTRQQCYRTRVMIGWCNLMWILDVKIKY